jgi:uncharacterized membrane protein
VLSFAVRIIALLVPLLGGFVSFLLYLAVIGIWAIGMLKAFLGERYKFPVFGDLAERQITHP